MNLDMLYEATRLTGDPKYAKIANDQAEASSKTHVRPNWTTFHVINFDQRTKGATLERRTHQGTFVCIDSYRSWSLINRLRGRQFLV